MTVAAPAKLNLFLAVTGRRPDGFHDLVSLVAQLEWGDALEIHPLPDEGSAASFTLSCDDPAVPRDARNLVLVAAEAFAQATGQPVRAAFSLLKRIPAGAGLGGGSSDAAAVLRALNELGGYPLAPAALAAVAAQVGSDCPLFLHPGAVVMRGRGERVEALPPAAAARLAGRRVLVIKPSFGISTPWAYGRLVAGAPGSYVPPAAAEARLAEWLEAPAPEPERLAFNSFEAVAFAKFAALPVLAAQLQEAFGLQLHLSGSGSACFALLDEAADVAPIVATVHRAWGTSALAIDTRFRG